MISRQKDDAVTERLKSERREREMAARKGKDLARARDAIALLTQAAQETQS